MAQKKLKPKVNLPKNVQNKKGTKKGSAVTKRANQPIQSKKKGITETRKLKQAIHKTVNKAVEEDIRSRVSNESNKPLSKAQEAVAEYHKKKASGSSQ
jgi:hypothetical protein